MTTQKLIILDRDGVINQDSDNFIKTPDEWIPLPGSLEAIVRLKKAGYIVAIATNQSGIARGLFSVDTLNKMHEKFHHLLKELGVDIDGIFYCPHGPDDNCECRKPKAGLYQKISQTFSIPLKGVPVIGDSGRDLDAAISVEASPILVLTGKGQKTALNRHDLKHLPRYQNLAAAVDAIVNTDSIKDGSI